LLPFDPRLRPQFAFRELHDWAQLMVERGVRVRVPFERFWTLDDVEAEQVQLLDDEEPMIDDLAFLQERQALKPY
jgi:hypothetical protein